MRCPKTLMSPNKDSLPPAPRRHLPAHTVRLLVWGCVAFFLLFLIRRVKLRTPSSASRRKQQKAHAKIKSKSERLRKTTPGSESSFLRHCSEFYWQQGSAFHMRGPSLTARCLFPPGTATESGGTGSPAETSRIAHGSARIRPQRPPAPSTTGTGGKRPLKTFTVGSI